MAPNFDRQPNPGGLPPAGSRFAPEGEAVKAETEARTHESEKPNRETPIKPAKERQKEIDNTTGECLNANALNKPEIKQIIGKRGEIDTTIRTMAAEASQFEASDTDTRLSAKITQSELNNLNAFLAEGRPQDLKEADYLLGNYLHRDACGQISDLFHKTDPTSLPWDAKNSILRKSREMGEILKSPNDSKTHKIFALREQIQDEIQQILPKKNEQKNTIPKPEAAQEFPAQQGEKKEDEQMDGKTKFGTVLNNFVKQFQDGTLPGLFRDFLKSNPLPQQYEGAASRLMTLYKKYNEDKRFRSDKIEEYKEKIVKLSEELNPDRLKFINNLFDVERELHIDNFSYLFKPLLERDEKPTAEQWKNASKKITDLIIEYRKDKRPHNQKDDEWEQKFKKLGQENFIS